VADYLGSDRLPFSIPLTAARKRALERVAAGWRATRSLFLIGGDE